MWRTLDDAADAACYENLFTSRRTEKLIRGIRELTVRHTGELVDLEMPCSGREKTLFTPRRLKSGIGAVAAGRRKK